MTEEQRIVYMRAHILAIEIEFEGMKIINRERAFSGQAPGYNQSDFEDLLERSLLTHNQCIVELTGHP